MYYFYDVLLFDARHQYEDRTGVKVKAVSTEEADKKASEEIKKFEAEYPYKVCISFSLEQAIPDHIVEG